MTETASQSYPNRLLEWAGHRAGGVRRLFHDTSGRPSGAVIRTHLLAKLEEWVTTLADGDAGAPRAVLLIGGPGNGKTEAVESAILDIDAKFALGGRLVEVLKPQFAPSSGTAVPRKAIVNLRELRGAKSGLRLAVVQDASVGEPSAPDASPAAQLVADLAILLRGEPDLIYLACVNRGILDEALVEAGRQGSKKVHVLLETVVRAVGLTPSAQSCWPMSAYPEIAVWPMDVESLVTTDPSTGTDSPARQVLASATLESQWPPLGSCPAGENCPFCTSRDLLSREPHRGALLDLLRQYELATGKRWSFRDLFSLVSYLLAGSPLSGDKPVTPCEWAAHLLQVESQPGSRNESLRLRAPFLLVSALYQHALFGHWPRISRRALRSDLKELKLDSGASAEPTLLGLHYFLSGGRALSIPATLEPQLAGISESLDPALASPDDDLEVSSRTVIKFREIDVSFSHSVREGLQFIRKYRCLVPLEIDLLQRLAAADDVLASAAIRRSRPAVANRVQALVREFACRLVRRSLGVRTAITRDAAILREFQRVIDGEEQLLYDAVKQVGGLLNTKDGFEVVLNTTFGEPYPPPARRVVLTTSKQKVKPREQGGDGRPNTPMRFLSVGSGRSTQAIPLTYELFRSIRELQAGMLPAALPRTVNALLDTTRARLAGRLVRDEDALDGAVITIGTRDESIVRELGKFLVRKGSEQ